MIYKSLNVKNRMCELHIFPNPVTIITKWNFSYRPPLYTIRLLNIPLSNKAS